MEKQNQRGERTFHVTALTAAYYFTKKPSFRPRPECYPFSQIFLILAGTGTYVTEEGTYRFGPGMMLYRPAGRTSRYEWDGEEAELALVDFECRSEAMATLPPLPIPLFGEERSTLLDLIKTTARVSEVYLGVAGEYHQRLRPDVPPVVLSFLYASLERFLSMVSCRLLGIELLTDETQKVVRQVEKSRLVAAVQTYLEEHISEPVTLAELCAYFHIGQTALSAAFRRETGKSLMEYFTDCRISAARARIEQGNATFTEIAEALGFSSVNYFSKVFRARTGMTPTAYSRALSKRLVASK